MRKQDITPRRERQLRFAEAGILFVFILGIVIFIGVRAGDQGDTPTVAAVEIASAVTAPEIASPAPAVAEAADSVVVTTVVPEPAPPAEPVVVTYPMAEAAYFAGDYTRAAELFTAYASTRPANAWGHYMLGLSAWKSGDATAADAAFTAALERKPDHFKSLINGARVLLDLERDDEAAARIATALELDPSSTDAQRVQARLCHRQGRIAAALAAYEAILRTDADDAWALNNLGLLMIEEERFDEALAPLARAASLRDAACIRNNLGIALERTGHYTAAAAAYEQALELDADHTKADISLERVAALVQNPTLDAIDLQALAAGYRVGDDDPMLAAALATELDLVAATVPAGAADEFLDEETAAPEAGGESSVPENDGEGNPRR